MVMRSVVWRMRCAIKVAETVARGDLSRAPHDDGNDELGRLMGALGNMVDSLSNMEASAISRPPQIV